MEPPPRFRSLNMLSYASPADVSRIYGHRLAAPHSFSSISYIFLREYVWHSSLNRIRRFQYLLVRRMQDNELCTSLSGMKYGSGSLNGSCDEFPLSCYISVLKNHLFSSSSFINNSCSFLFLERIAKVMAIKKAITAIPAIATR